jgi:hypothetical protein
MKNAAPRLALLALALTLSACADTRALIGCVIYQNDINKRCQ